MQRAYCWKPCPFCGREVSEAGGGYRRHVATHSTKRVDDRLRRLLVQMLTSKDQNGMGRKTPRLDGFSFTYADAKRLQHAGLVHVERSLLFAPRSFIAHLTVKGTAFAQRALRELPNAKGGVA